MTSVGVAKCSKCGLEAVVTSISDTRKSASVSTEQLKLVCQFPDSARSHNECKYLNAAIILELQTRNV